MRQNKEENNELKSPTGGQEAFVPVYYFTNYIEANILLGRMQEEGINCWLKDENTVTINPIWTQAVGGIKLMVAQVQAERAKDILAQIKTDKMEQNACPQCGSENVEFVSTPRKAVNWFTALFGFFLGDHAVAGSKVYHCFDCGHEFTAMEERNID
jgi:DNA-directed RNA polymerase subunit RPC12/RpoP